GSECAQQQHGPGSLAPWWAAFGHRCPNAPRRVGFTSLPEGRAQPPSSPSPRAVGRPPWAFGVKSWLYSAGPIPQHRPVPPLVGTCHPCHLHAWAVEDAQSPRPGTTDVPKKPHNVCQSEKHPCTSLLRQGCEPGGFSPFFPRCSLK
uniref:Uncharacterized protein n=1 Tax=Anser cygnoides TaxID=8845 RepID=A0A8B9EML2_ANSCY